MWQAFVKEAFLKKHPTLNIKNIPNEHLPIDLIEPISNNYKEISNLEVKEKKVVTSKKMIYGVKPCMCVYPIEHYVRLIQRFMCLKYDHLTVKFQAEPNQVAL